MKENIDGAGKVADLSFALGVPAMGLYRFIPTGCGTKRVAELAPTPKQLNDALRALDERSGRYKMPIAMGIPIEPCLLDHKPKNIKVTICMGALNKFTVDPAGNLRACEQSPHIIGSLRENEFTKLLLKPQVKKFKRNIPEECRGCKHARTCRGGCRFLSSEMSALRRPV